MPRKATPTFREYAPQFLKAMQASEKTPGTIANYRSHIHKWLLPQFGNLHLSSITRAEVYDLTDNIPVVVGRSAVYSTLNVMMTLAHDRFDYIPEWTTRVPGVGGDKSKPRPDFELEHFNAIVNQMPEHMRAPLRIGLGAALRIGEICGLNVGDWNPEQGALTISRQYNRGEVKETKTKVIGEVYPILDAQRLLDEAVAAARATPASWNAMFTGPRGARLHPVLLRKEWAIARRWANVPEMRVHDTRHVGLTTYARIPGVTLADIQAHGRHKTIQSALRYQHAQSADRRRQLSQSTHPAL